MPDKTKAPKELVELAAEQGSHAAKNLGAAATEAVEGFLPKPSGGIFIPNKALGGVTGVVALAGAIALANRIKREKALKAEAEKNGAVIKPVPVPKDPGKAA